MRKRILILDDDAALLDVLKILLEDNGYDPVLVKHTEDLFSLVELHRPSLILLDFRLNGRDGGDWCIQLKSHPEFKIIPVIIFTACTMELQVGSYGCDDFIAKPFDIEDILKHIERLIVKNDPAVSKLEISNSQDQIPSYHDGH